LRHAESGEGDEPVPLAPDGTLPVDYLLGYKLFAVMGATVADIRRVVEDPRKLRFKFPEVDGELYVKSCQGQSGVAGQLVDFDLVLTPAYIGDGRVQKIMLHGTQERFCAGIARDGLWPGGLRGPQ